MSKILKFAKGYIITVRSYENDGDNTKQQTIHVDTLEKVYAIVELLKTFKTSSFSNCYDFDDDEQQEFYNFINSFGEKYETLLGQKCSHILRKVGLTDTEWMTREMNEYTVEHLEEDVYVSVIKV